MNTSLVLVNHQSPVPPYEQIKLQIQTLIASGQLLSGDRLPSVRQLANDLAVAPNTVMRAYSELERAGWVQTSARRGVLVASETPTMTEEERRCKLREAVHQILITIRQLGFSVEEVSSEICRQASSSAMQGEIQTPPV